MKTLAIDLETCSELNISKIGVYKYAENCEVLLCAYAYDDEPVQIEEFIKVEAMTCGEEITGGLNLNSNVQIKRWIEEQEGLELSNLDKAAVYAINVSSSRQFFFTLAKHSKITLSSTNYSFQV